MKLKITSNVPNCKLLIVNANDIKKNDSKDKIVEWLFNGELEDYTNQIKKVRKVMIRMRKGGYLPYEKEHYVNEAIHIVMHRDIT